MATYDRIGQGYAGRRRPDPRIAAQIEAALGEAGTVLNVGAGAGSYEPAGCAVTALEPAWTMIAQRPAEAAPAVCGRAEALPFADDAFDAVMAVLTVHHWADQAAGLSELRRVSRGPVVILTFDPAFRGFWLTDYLPGLIALDEAQMPDMAAYEAALGSVAITPVAVPHDCVDGFLCAYWRRPEMYLQAEVRRASSSFWALGDIAPALDQLRRDLEDGRWDRRYGALRHLDALDCGYRLVRTL
jgi:SAM-dependent methyltransferase